MQCGRSWDSDLSVTPMALQESLVATRAVLLRGTPAKLAGWQAVLTSLFHPDTPVLALGAALKDLPPVLDKPVNECQRRRSRGRYLS